MLGRTIGAVLVGVDARLIEIEVDLAGGLPGIAATGLPDSTVREGFDRIRTAVARAGFRMPRRRVVVNLAPAEVRKQGASLDLPIALAMLVADEQVAAGSRGVVIVGELGLDGAVRPVRGALAIATAARGAGCKRLVVPHANASEAALVRDIEIRAVATLGEAAHAWRGEGGEVVAEPGDAILDRALATDGAPDLADVRGQAAARRALEIAAAGGHHLLLSGPPGAGKTMLARRLPGILPAMTRNEALDVTRVWSAAGLAHGLVTTRPFRAPHHGISLAGLAGGGPGPRPGELTLASGGVLYLDEMTEFRREALEALRQPLEDGSITVARLRGRVEFPARFMLVASMNPCPCGHHGSPAGRCRCTPPEIRRYLNKLSGPLLDRFDLVVDVPAVEIAALATSRPGEASAAVRGRVLEARDRQRRRFGSAGPTSNARMGSRDLDRHAALDTSCRRLLIEACERLGLSARAWDRVRRVARTLADLEGAESIGPAHVAEAVQYRRSGVLGGG